MTVSLKSVDKAPFKEWIDEPIDKGNGGSFADSWIRNIK